ncbi:CRISPR-associated endoribonuclease Cse3 [Calidithermus terrae]|uniref:CRISPR-associated endoribonuclease Cse3 n=1 Tax=Calidithermus terrae TaxID=1408545 RepID=A0A399ETB4_9DEIN|nr:type I-E CRISPR-associated protein Cas6/Cse3/CasE [Calidithermus terrae]RIH87844.1 CRISPR-associated endoribonuclease Cse3 [Calidithermus terrae]
MYLSRLRPDRSHARARADLASPYELHATLCRALAGEGQAPPRFLWRLEAGRVPAVLVQSLEMPDWQRLERRYPGYFAQAPESKPVPLEHLRPGQVLRFRLRANPTVTRKDPHNPEKRKRHGLKDVEAQLQWLERQGGKGGFSVLGAAVAQSERVRTFKHAGGSPIVLQAVLYEGRLRVTDLEAFKNTLTGGLGHAKALGFGLLSVARG